MGWWAGSFCEFATCLGHGRFASTGDCWHPSIDLHWPWTKKVRWVCWVGQLLRSGCSCSVVLRRGPEVLIVTILSLLRWKRFQRVNSGAAIPKDHAAQTLRSLVPETPCVMVTHINLPFWCFFLKQIQCMKFSLDVSFIYKYLESRAA